MPTRTGRFLQRLIGSFLLTCAALGGAPGLANAQIVTTTALSLTSANPVTGDVKLDFRVSGCAPDGVPYETGTIQVFEGTTPVYSFTLSTTAGPFSSTSSDGPCTGGTILSNGLPPFAAAMATPMLPAVSPGTHIYTAVYGGDVLYGPSTSPALTVTIPPRPSTVVTTTALTLTRANSVTGDVKLDFRVSGCAPDGVPYETGTIQVFEGATPVYSFTLSTTPGPFAAISSDGSCAGGTILSNGLPPIAAAMVTPMLPAVSPGTHIYTAVYSGDAFYSPSTSSELTVTIPPRPSSVATATSFSLTSANSVTGDVTLNFRVSGCAPDATPYESGTIQVFDGATPVYTLTLTLPGNPGSAPSSDGSCAGGAILSNGSSPIAPVGFPTLPAVSPGTHAFTAVYSGDAFYAASTSSTITVIIPPRPGSVATVIALGLTSSNSVTGDVTLNFRVSGCAPDAAPYESGTIQIFEGATPVYTFTLSPPGSPGTGFSSDGPCTGGTILSNGSLPIAPVGFPTLRAVSPGTHTYTAVYSGDAFYVTSTSSPITVTIPPRPASVATATTLSLANTNSITGDVSLNFRVSGCAQNATPYESGTIKIFDAATLVYAFTLSSPGNPGSGFSSDGPCAGGTILSNGSLPISAVLSPTLPAVSPGTHSYTAVYSGDSFFAPSTSPAITVQVTALPTVTPGQSFGGPTATHTGNATLSMSGGGPLCGFTRAEFLPVNGNPFSPPAGSVPPGLRFPHGLIAFATSGCTPGSTLTFTLTLPTPSAAGGRYMKYGPTPDQPAPHWYRVPASIQGNVVTFSITDGALGDDDLTANGTVVDAGGLAIGDPAIPTLSEWMLLFLALLLGSTGAYATMRHGRVDFRA